MTSPRERLVREERAKRLVTARKNAKFSGPTAVCKKFGWNINTYKAHEQGRNGFSVSDAQKYAEAFGVSADWLNYGEEPRALRDRDNDNLGPPIDIELLTECITVIEGRLCQNLAPIDVESKAQLIVQIYSHFADQKISEHSRESLRHIVDFQIRNSIIAS